LFHQDVHSRYRTESSGDPIARFNERFILSLGSCPTCLVLDDELNVLPISAGKDIASIPSSSSSANSAAAAELKQLKASLADTQPVGAVVDVTVTLDQAKALLTFTDAIASKTLSTTAALTAARGRGKSACLGLAIALAVAHGYANIFVTSPSPENLGTVFEFIFKGLEKLGYTEHLDWEVMRSSNKDWKGVVVRVNIFRDHRQTIQVGPLRTLHLSLGVAKHNWQYIQPQDAHVLGQAELVVIDEAAAIPLPLVRALMGPYLVFLSSTVNGYEGTGRSLSLKLIQQLRESSRPSLNANGSADDSSIVSNKHKADHVTPSTIARSLKEIKLDQPIRYGNGDAIESWLNSLLCLDATVVPLRRTTGSGAPHPPHCDLYHVSRDTLFSFHPASEAFLQRMMALYVASHYKNSPNDLQLLSDAPGHRLFVLLPPINEDEADGSSRLPEPLVVLQVALEGRISKKSILNSLERGQRAGGDLIPWTISQQFQDDDFASLSGARVVRIAVHPDYAKVRLEGSLSLFGTSS
jgi:N-acetyltransferase 10